MHADLPSVTRLSKQRGLGSDERPVRAAAWIDLHPRRLKMGAQRGTHRLVDAITKGRRQLGRATALVVVIVRTGGYGGQHSRPRESREDEVEFVPRPEAATERRIRMCVHIYHFLLAYFGGADEWIG